MSSILEKLWEDYIYPDEGCQITTPEEKELTSYITRHSDSLLASMTEKQKEVFEKFSDCQFELTNIRERELFVYAFRLGAQVMLESMQPINEE